MLVEQSGEADRSGTGEDRDGQQAAADEPEREQRAGKVPRDV